MTVIVSNLPNIGPGSLKYRDVAPSSMKMVSSCSFAVNNKIALVQLLHWSHKRDLLDCNLVSSVCVSLCSL